MASSSFFLSEVAILSFSISFVALLVLVEKNQSKFFFYIMLEQNMIFLPFLILYEPAGFGLGCIHISSSWVMLPACSFCTVG